VSFSVSINVKQTPPFVRKDDNLTVPLDGLYVQALHSWDVLSADPGDDVGVVKYPVPSIVNAAWGWRVNYEGRSLDYYPLQDQWQQFLYNFWDWCSGYRLPPGRVESTYTKPTNSGTFLRCTPGSKMWLYVDMTEVSRAWTDAANREQGSRCIVTGRNLTAKPYEWLLRITTGHMMKVIGQDASKYFVSCIDMTKPPPAMDVIEKHPEWVCWATQVYPNENIATRFPQIKKCFELLGLPPHGTAVPLMAPGGVASINKSACRVLKGGDVWSPYYP